MCRVGLWGTFDVEDYGLLLHPRIVRHELRRRLPDADVRTYSPYGYQRPTRMDGGDPAEPLSAAVFGELDCLIVHPSFLRPDDELSAVYGVPVEDIAARRPALPDEYVTAEPDAALLAPRHFPPEVLAKRLQFLRLMGWFPPEGSAVVVQGSGRDLASVDEVAARVRGSGQAVVLLELAPYEGDGDFADAMGAVLADAGTAVHRMPAAVSHEDIVAAVSAADAFMGTSVAGLLTFDAYHRPDRARIEALDASFDRIAETAVTRARRQRNGASPSATTLSPDYAAALRRAHQLRGERLARERVVFADHVADLQRALVAASATAKAAQQQASADADGRRVAEADLAALRATQPFWWSQKARGAYEWWRQLRSRA